jgi:D-aspartate ligase
VDRMLPARADVPEACVIGDADLLRPLVLAGVPRALVARSADPARRSRHITTVLDAPADWNDTGALLERLLAYGRAQKRPPVLYYQWDEHLLFVSRNRDLLRSAFRFVIAPPEVVEALVDKSQFSVLAARLGLPVPHTSVVPPNVIPIVDELPEFPVIVKPVNRTYGRWGDAVAAKAVRVETPEQLATLWRRLGGLRTDVLVQELIPGPESMIESYHCFLDDKGQIVADFTGRKIRTRPGEYGTTTALVLTEQDDVRELGLHALRATRCTGVSKVDMKRTADGSLKVLEINPRYNLWHHPGAIAGVNLPGWVHERLTGVTLSRLPPQPGVRWMRPDDVLAAREQGVSMARWLPWATGVEAKSLWAWADPVPFATMAKASVKNRWSNRTAQVLERSQFKRAAPTARR